MNYASRGPGRRGLLSFAAAATLAAALPSTGVLAQDLSGELVILQWQGGTDADLWAELEADFMARHPGVTIRELTITAQGDARGGIRTALMGGETVDIIINTWPAFRAELADAGLLRPVDEQWEAMGWSERLNQSWRNLGMTDGVTYGVQYTYGNRSGIWYDTSHLADAGITPPQTWEEFLAAIEGLRAAGFETPIPMPAKYWAHGEWFENLLLRVGGVEAASQLASREIPWTSDVVRETMLRFAELVNAGCCGTPEDMFAGDWDMSADTIFKADGGNFLLIGMWMNARARNDYGLTEGIDYAQFQFPALGLGHDNTASVDAKELLVTTDGANPEAADAFLDYITSAPATEILAKYGYASPSTAADTSLLGPVQQQATAAVAASQVQFVLGDLLPGDLVDEYRVQLQRFLQDPTPETIDSVLAAIEAKAAVSY